MKRSIAAINSKIKKKQAQVCTVSEIKKRLKTEDIKTVASTVDVITTGTFEPMESCGAVINLGHTDPPIRIRQCWLDGVQTYAGLGAVDLYLGAAQPAEDPECDRGGAHVIADLIGGKGVHLRAVGQSTDCYPRSTFDNTITRDTINQFYLFNPRGLYQNFIVGVNGGDRPLYTYLGPLAPRFGNAVYCNPGAIAPLFNDPDLQLIGVGSRIFLGGGIGYITGEGTQHFPLQKRLPNRTPIGPGATLGVMGDARTMNPQWVRGCYLRNYGPALMLGVGLALPVLHEGVVERCAIEDGDIMAPIVDFAIPRRVRPTFGLVSYAQLKSGAITIEGKTVRTAPLSSIYFAQQIAQELKQWITAGQFMLTEPVASIPLDRSFLSQDDWGSQMNLS